MNEVEKIKQKIIELKIFQTICLWILAFCAWKEILMAAILVTGVIALFTNEIVIRLIEELNNERLQK